MRSIWIPLIAATLVLLGAPATSADEPIQVTNSYTYAYSPRLWATCVSFKNVTEQPIMAVQFQFTYIDAFDTPIQSNRGDRVGRFATGVLIEGATDPSQLPGPGVGGGNISQHAANCWYVSVVAGSLSKITTEVEKVRYADGTIWNNTGPMKVFTANYMSATTAASLDDLPHPDIIVCKPGLLGPTKYNWHGVEFFLKQKNAKMIACYNAWLQEDGYPPYGTAPTSLTTPSPAPSST